jgi:transposase
MSKARLVITAVTVEKRPVSEVARSCGVARSWIYELLARYQDEGEAAFEPRSRRPKTSPRATAPDTVELIIRLRKELAGQGLDAGPQTIAWHLEQHHQLKVSPATVSRCLTRHGLVTPDPSKRPKSSYIRFAAEMPNECWQADFTHYPLADGADTEILTWSRRPLPLRPAGHRPPPGHRARRAAGFPRRLRAARRPRLEPH